MNSIPASSAICASLRQSGQLPDQRSGTVVIARPEEQFAPNRPSLSRFALPIAARSPCPTVGSMCSLAVNAPGGSLAEPDETCQAQPQAADDAALIVGTLTCPATATTGNPTFTWAWPVKPAAAGSCI